MDPHMARLTRHTTQVVIKAYASPLHQLPHSLTGSLQPSYPTQTEPQYQQSQSTGQQQTPNYQGKPPKEDKLSGLLGKLQGTVTEIGSEFAQKLGTTIDPQAYAEYGPSKPNTEHRFGSFAPPREHNDAKWYVDGCSYFWAVSRALENARESIWILDCKFGSSPDFPCIHGCG
jgi:phosphatidylserine/phosphatidylglycerophosphate/cardiolipin synthase-like enzyme